MLGGWGMGFPASLGRFLPSLGPRTRARGKKLHADAKKFWDQLDITLRNQPKIAKDVNVR